jgi:hypothetical protein
MLKALELMAFCIACFSFAVVSMEIGFWIEKKIRGWK